MADQYASSWSREEFIEHFRDKFEHIPELIVDPQQVDLTPDQLIQAVGQKYMRLTKRDDFSYIENLIKNAIDPAHHKTYQDQIVGLMGFAGRQILSYSVAKRLLPKFLQRYGLAMAPNTYDRLKKGPHFG
jgi:hypothetical protein